MLIEDAPDTLIGGDVEVFDSNVISANRNGIAIVGSGAKGTIIQQNLIGTNLAGEQRLGNLQDGIFLGLKSSLFGYSGLGAVSSPVEGPPSNTTIGGTSAAARNIKQLLMNYF